MFFAYFGITKLSSLSAGKLKNAIAAYREPDILSTGGEVLYRRYAAFLIHPQPLKRRPLHKIRAIALSISLSSYPASDFGTLRTSSTENPFGFGIMISAWVAFLSKLFILILPPQSCT